MELRKNWFNIWLKNLNLSNKDTARILEIPKHRVQRYKKRDSLNLPPWLVAKCVEIPISVEVTRETQKRYRKK